MPNPLTREEAIAFREKYRIMGEKRRDRACHTPAERAAGLLFLMTLASELGWLVKSPEKEAEEHFVYERWALIKSRVAR